MRRTPAVAGQFYHGAAEKLKKQVKDFIKQDVIKEHAIGIVSPHA
jgi:AmmeMemoRadiSam system protein B